MFNFRRICAFALLLGLGVTRGQDCDEDTKQACLFNLLEAGRAFQVFIPPDVRVGSSLIDACGSLVQYTGCAAKCRSEDDLLYPLMQTVADGLCNNRGFIAIFNLEVCLPDVVSSLSACAANVTSYLADDEITCGLPSLLDHCVTKSLTSCMNSGQARNNMAALISETKQKLDNVTMHSAVCANDDDDDEDMESTTALPFTTGAPAMGCDIRASYTCLSSFGAELQKLLVQVVSESTMTGQISPVHAEKLCNIYRTVYRPCVDPKIYFCDPRETIFHDVIRSGMDYICVSNFTALTSTLSCLGNPTVALGLASCNAAIPSSSNDACSISQNYLACIDRTTAGICSERERTALQDILYHTLQPLSDLLGCDNVTSFTTQTPEITTTATQAPPTPITSGPITGPCSFDCLSPLLNAYMPVDPMGGDFSLVNYTDLCPLYVQYEQCMVSEDCPPVVGSATIIQQSLDYVCKQGYYDILNYTSCWIKPEVSRMFLTCFSNSSKGMPELICSDIAYSEQCALNIVRQECDFGALPVLAQFLNSSTLYIKRSYNCSEIIALPTTTETTTFESTTSTPEPEGEPTGTISPEPEGEPEGTLSPEPEGEPTGTLSPEPEGEPTGTLSPEPEGESTWTSSPEPEVEPTGTLSPEPELTRNSTTSKPEVSSSATSSPMETTTSGPTSTDSSSSTSESVSTDSPTSTPEARPAVIRCFDCNSWANPHCPPSGDVTTWYHPSNTCPDRCFARVVIEGGNKVVYRGCAAGHWMPEARPLPRSGCRFIRGTQWCFCDSDECNTMDMTRFL